MKNQSRYSTFISSMFLYAGIVLSCTILVVVLMKLWKADLTVPFSYNGDALLCGEWVKSVARNGWYIHNSSVGMPTGKDLGDFPMSDNVHYLVMKLVSLFTGDWAVIMNLFFLLTFPLITLSSYYVFRQFRLSVLGSYTGSILFTFLHYHFMRGMNHIFLSAYYLVPLAVLVSIWLVNGDIDGVDDSSAPEQTTKQRKKVVSSGIICFLVAGAGIYYAFFTCFFIMLAGLLRTAWDRRLRPTVIATVLIGVVCVGGIINLSPHIIHRIQNGPNKVSTARVYHEVELYALKITGLLLPASGHRIPALAAMKKQYIRESSYVHQYTGELDNSSLGIVAGSGFVFLIFFLVFNRNAHDAGGVLNAHHYQLLRYLSIFTIAAVLVASVGGFNSFINIILRFMIRSYARVSIFIAFFSIAAFFIVIEALHKRFIAGRFTAGAQGIASTAVYGAILGAIMLVGLLDQTAAAATPDYTEIKKRFQADRAYIAGIEKIMPAGSMIFQLPYMAYPETKPPGGMDLYDHFRGYLNSDTLRWSYGAMKGRETDAWQKETIALPTAEMLRRLKSEGFSGIYINRRGYADNGESIVSEIGRLTGSRAVENADKGLVFFDIRPAR